MVLTIYKEDILPYIVDSEKSLSARAVAVGGCITVLSLIKLCYNVTNDSITGSAELDTPLGKIPLGSFDLNPQHPTATIGGGAFGFKAEVEISFDFNTDVLKICGKVCAPFAGCKSGCTSIHV
ncbi:hypothetical protein [uncultured Nostoc sp.]|uniref:hypothetical protein n=1 Tax=uncultured Nostoc sp. TaxID=340711 RepID=UPI0035CAC1AD